MTNNNIQIGDHFGHWTVIGEKFTKSKNAYYPCQCDCGTKKDVRGSCLKKGESTSCGCIKRDKVQPGQRFGRLTTITKTMVYDDEAHQRGRSCWLCQCDCGNQKMILQQSLLSGNTQSCGCLQKEIASQHEDLTGQHFGKLTVIKEAKEKLPDGKLAWVCQCECGNITVVRATALRANAILSCGCVKSKGELKIIELLQNNHIPYKYQYSVNTNNHLFIYDFYVDNKYIIEYDGAQHYRDVEYWGSKLEDVQKNDNAKNQYCFDNNIPIIRIPYTHLTELVLKDLLLETSTYIIKPE